MSYKLLIVEDEKVIRRGLVCSMDWRGLGFDEILEAADGEEAIALIRAEHPDIVIMDINIPVKNGLEVLRETESEGYCVIILSGYADFRFAQRAIKSGAVSYLLKPVDFQELTEAIGRAKEELRRRFAYSEILQAKEAIREIDVLKEIESGGVKSEFAQQTTQYIKEHFHEKLTLHMLSEKLHYNETFLMRKFKAEIGIGFNEYLTRCRIQAATVMLRSGSKNMDEVAWKCGFQSAKYFYKVFIRYVGCSPREFVHLIQKKQ